MIHNIWSIPTNQVTIRMLSKWLCDMPRNDFPRIIPFHKINDSNKKQKMLHKAKQNKTFKDGTFIYKWNKWFEVFAWAHWLTDWFWSTFYQPKFYGPIGRLTLGPKEISRISKLSWFIFFKPFWTFVAFFSKETNFVGDFSVD